MCTPSTGSLVFISLERSYSNIKLNVISQTVCQNSSLVRILTTGTYKIGYIIQMVANRSDLSLKLSIHVNIWRQIILFTFLFGSLLLLRAHLTEVKGILNSVKWLNLLLIQLLWQIFNLSSNRLPRGWMSQDFDRARESVITRFSSTHVIYNG